MVGLGLLHKCLALSAVTNQRNDNLLLVSQYLGRFQQCAQVIGQTVGARVHGDKLPVEIHLIPHNLTVNTREHGCVHSVGHHLYLVHRHATGEQVRDKTWRVDDNPVGVAIEEAFKPPRNPDKRSVVQDSHVNSEVRPQVAYFQNKGHSLPLGQQVGGHRLKNRWRCAPNQVNLSYHQPFDQGRSHETEESDQTAHSTSASGRVGPRSQDA